MDEQKANWRRRWLEWGDAVGQQFTQSGLGDIAGALKAASAPLVPVAAELVWLVQPVFALFGEAAAIDALADLLAEPDQGNRHLVSGPSDSPESR